MDYVTTNNFSIPAIGFGTFQLEGIDVVRMVRYVLDLGYRHIDTAQIYDNEVEVGQGIREANVPREDIFITTKVWIDNYSHSKLASSVDKSLTKLDTDYIDLLLLHWPNPGVPLRETLKALQAVKEAGKTRQIGLSNFTTALMRKAEAICGKGVIVNNQIEYHPYLWQDKIIEQAKALDMSITAYMPLAGGKALKDKTLIDIGAKYNKTPAQISLRWLIQQGIAVIPSSTKEHHAQQNFDIFDFSLADDDMTAINALQTNIRIVSPQKLAPNWDTKPSNFKSSN